jgi:DNA (cytosine-5)-methyltransferase 1
MENIQNTQVWENVCGAFSSNKGWDFHAVSKRSVPSVTMPYQYLAFDPKRTDKLVWNGAGEVVGDNYSVAWRTLTLILGSVPAQKENLPCRRFWR